MMYEVIADLGFLISDKIALWFMKYISIET